MWGGGTEGGYDDVSACKGGAEGIDGFVVDGQGLDGRGNGDLAGRAGEDGDIKGGFSESIDDGKANCFSGLRC